jgi:hypothetical protein
MNSNYQVAAYYFPNFHSDRRNEEWHGKDWMEWNLVKGATPRFEGHNQPKIPIWGYEDESSPSVMNKKIEAASNYGISSFIFDWYWYDNGPYLHNALEQGFLKADNREKLKFSLMWANHDWVDIHPAQRSRPCNILSKGAVSLESFRLATNYIIGNYFNQPNYWRIDNGLYFSIYELMSLINGLGGLDDAKMAIEDFRNRVRIAGLGELHLNAVVWGIQILPGEKRISNPEQLITELGFDSVTSYVWVHHQALENFPIVDYAEYAKRNFADYIKFSQNYDVPYYPNVTMGWDPSPRTIQTDSYENTGYPATPILSNNTPVEFEKALMRGRDFLDSMKSVNKILTINAWNEWTEGSYLEPDTINGMGYLEAVNRVFDI